MSNLRGGIRGHLEMFSGGSALRSWQVALFYAACLALLGLLRDFSPQPQLLVELAEFLRVSVRAGSDPHTFAKAAAEVAANGWLTPGSQWVFRLWPPGFILLTGTIFRVAGINAPFLLILFILSVLLGTLMLSVFRKYLLAYVSAGWATALPLVPFLFPVTRFALLQPLGLAFGEGFSIMFFITAVFFALLSVRHRSVTLAAAAGLAFASAAYFRSQYELIVVFMAIFAAPLVAYLLFSMRRRVPLDRAESKAIIWTIVIVVLATQLLMLPWRIHNFLDLGKMNWVHTQDLVARNSLTPADKLLELGGGFVVEGGGHLACQLSPKYCNSSDTSDFYRAFVENMGAWYLKKSSLLGDYWFSSVAHFPKKVKPGSPPELLGNALMLLSVLVSLALLWRKRKKYDFPLHFWIQSSFYACFFIVFSLVQLETRYFYLMKIFALCSAIALGCDFLANRRKGGNFQGADLLKNPDESQVLEGK